MWFADSPPILQLCPLSRNKVVHSVGRTRSNSVKSLGIGDLALPFVLTNEYRSGILSEKRRGSVNINRRTEVALQAVQQ